MRCYAHAVLRCCVQLRLCVGRRASRRRVCPHHVDVACCCCCCCCRRRLPGWRTAHCRPWRRSFWIAAAGVDFDVAATSAAGAGLRLADHSGVVVCPRHSGSCPRCSTANTESQHRTSARLAVCCRCQRPANCLQESAVSRSEAHTAQRRRQSPATSTAASDDDCSVSR